MSAKLPAVSGQEALRAFLRLGYEVVRQRGSHIRLRHVHDATRRPFTVPDHRTLKPGLLRKLISDAQRDVDGFG
ncbi:MAG: type II toxin-antitoxin system HicA family toxin [Candidatus Rokuibacteriota bacterium]